MRLSNDWENISEIILYGYGNVGRSCLERISQDFIVNCIIDQDADKRDSNINGIEMVSLEEGLSRRKKQKIIVMTGGRVYLEIANILRKHNLVEFEDFCNIEYFITEWYWKYRHENCLMEIHMAITMKCTLKCKYCNMFVPYYHEPVTYSLESIKREMELLFDKIDYIFCFVLLGGEPFLHQDLSDIIQYIGNKYEKRIGTIKIITNGTIVPADGIMDELRKVHSLWISISNYTNQVPYQQKLKELRNKLDQYAIPYTINVMDTWCDFFFPKRYFNINKNRCAGHMRACSPIFHGYNDGKIFYCHVAWSAEKIGRYELQNKDYINLSNINGENNHDIALHCNGEIRDGYISFCKNCGGCGKDNTSYVIAGEQC